MVGTLTYIFNELEDEYYNKPKPKIKEIKTLKDFVNNLSPFDSNSDVMFYSALTYLKRSEKVFMVIVFPKESWFTYMVYCKDGSLYTGVTNNLYRRLKQHNKGQGAKYTKKRYPVDLVYHESFETEDRAKNKSDAFKREYAIKQLSRKDKIKLVLDNKEKAEKLYDMYIAPLSRRENSWT